MNVEIVFENNYPYDDDYFAMTLSNELKSNGYILKAVRYANVGEKGAILVDGDPVGLSHPVNTLLTKVESLCDNTGTSNVF